MAVLDTIGIWATAIAVGLGTFLAWWRSRRAATIPFYRGLKASLDDADKYHWVRVNNNDLFEGKVVKITKTTITLDHPLGGNDFIAVSHLSGACRLDSLVTSWHDWVPCLDSDRTADDPYSPEARIKRVRRVP